MKIEPILYNTTRGIYSVEDKLSIATLILFCWKLGGLKFAELLYTNDIEAFSKSLNEEYSDYDIDLTIKFSDKQIKNSLIMTIQEVIVKYDSDGYYKALNDGDEFALVINNIVNYEFNKIEFKKMTKNIIKQLEINFN